MNEKRIRELAAQLPNGTPRDPARIEPMIARLRALWLSNRTGGSGRSSSMPLPLTRSTSRTT
jgi:hypothetical protein